MARKHRRAASADDPPRRIDFELGSLGRRGVRRAINEMDEHRMRVGDPQSVGIMAFGFMARRCRDDLATMRRDFGRHVIKPIGAKRNVMQALARRAAEQRQATAQLPGTAEKGDIAIARRHQPGIGVELDAVSKVRHLQCQPFRAQD